MRITCITADIRVQIHWSGSYDGYGTGSLDRDCDELEALVKHLRDRGVSEIVLMGHSTGSQDVIHYLTSKREPVEGGIMVAPASDREFFERNPDREWAAALKQAKQLIKEGKPKATLDVGGMRMSAYRMHSLVGVGGDDDYFSSDLPDASTPDTPHVHPLSTSFGRLSAPALALWCEGDHCGNGDQRPLLRRWEAAAAGKLAWHVLEGATHCVEEAGPQAVLAEQVVGWLAQLRSGAGQPGPARA